MMKKMIAMTSLLLLLAAAASAKSIQTTFQVTCTVVYQSHITSDSSGVRDTGLLQPHTQSQTITFHDQTPPPMLNEQTDSGLRNAAKSPETYTLVTLAY